MPDRLVLKDLAQLLPRTFRERVFEPAWADLVLTERTDHSARGPGAVAQLTLLATCLWVLVLRMASQQVTLSRPLRTARNVLFLLVMIGYVILRARYGRAAAR